MHQHSEIKAIQTFYNGYTFRSRLEARWACFLDALGMPYEYEKEGFDLGKSGWYLPDFYLPASETWLEVKPREPSAEEREKAKVLTLALDEYVDILVGIPRHPDGDWFGVGQVLHCYPGSTPPGRQGWCPLSLVVPFWCGPTKGNEPYLQHAVAYAVEQARSARFEHGEVPVIYDAMERANFAYHGADWEQWKAEHASVEPGRQDDF
jgi:hypothetical protein